MKGIANAIGVMIFLICLFSVKAYSSTYKAQTYVSRNSLINIPQCRYSGLLFPQQMEDSVKLERADSIKLKDPKMAVFYAVIPGILVHGAGHFYAEKPKTGLILFGAEALGLLFLMRGVASEFRENDSDGSGAFEGITGFTLVLGSWIYDLIGAPLAIERKNQKLLGKKTADLKF
jgi:hypothetical protein